MKLAIPVKTNKNNPAVSPLFGKAKWFAFVKDNQITIKENIYHNGADIIRWFVNENVNVLIIKEIGISPYHMIRKLGNIDIFYAGDNRIELTDVIDKFYNNQLQTVNETNINKIIQQHQPMHKNKFKRI